MGKIILLDDTTMYPLTKIGARAGICYGADTENAEKNAKRGRDCLLSLHGRALEFVNVEMVIKGYSARVIREWYTHIGGAPTRLQESTRYIYYEHFDYIIPPSVRANEKALSAYANVMEVIRWGLERMNDCKIPREDAGMLLPLAMQTGIVCKHNLRNLIDMSRQRLCARAYWEYRELFRDIMSALSGYSDEWKEIIDTQFMPKCEYIGYCPEKKSCGRTEKHR